MASTTIKTVYIYYREGGALADAYSVTLASEDGSYGIQTASGTVVIASGTAVSNPSTGLYEKAFTASEGQTYVIAWKIVNNVGDDPNYITQQVEVSLGSGITAVARHVGDFTQGETVSLFLKTTQFDGTPDQAESVSVTITEDSSGDEVESGTAKIMKDGYYAYAWNILQTQDVGDYSITWTYTIGGVAAVELQTISVFEESASMHILSGVSPELLLTFETYIDCAMNIPVYNEESRPSSDRRTFRWSFANWNQTPGTRVWINNQPVVSGITIDYFRGTVVFDEELTEYDVVEATYNFSWYKPEDLARFLINAVNVMNSFPPHSAFNVRNIPDRYVPAMLYKAAADAIRKMMLCLQFQQPQQVFGGPDKAQQAFSNFDSLKKNYEADWKVIAENKKYGPYLGLTQAVVVPEYTLPGGRSRWFRYLFSSGV